MQFNPWKKPENQKVLRTFDFTPFKMSADEFAKNIFGPRIDEPQGILSKVKALFASR